MKMPSSQQIDKEVFRKIFTDHWDDFKEQYPNYGEPQYEEIVQKMLGCGKETEGYSEYRCHNCGGDVRRIGFSCKSCFFVYHAARSMLMRVRRMLSENIVNRNSYEFFVTLL